PRVTAAKQSVIGCPHRHGVEENVVVFLCLIVQKISARTEVERTTEIRAQTHLFAELPRMFLGQVFAHEPIAATQLRIAEITSRCAIATGRSWTAIVAGCDTAFANRQISVITAEVAIWRKDERRARCLIDVIKDSWLGVEPVEIFSRPEE